MISPDKALRDHSQGLVAERPEQRRTHKGRKPLIDPAEIHQLPMEEKPEAVAIARGHDSGLASIYRVLRPEQPETGGFRPAAGGTV